MRDHNPLKTGFTEKLLYDALSKSKELFNMTEWNQIPWFTTSDFFFIKKWKCTFSLFTVLNWLVVYPLTIRVYIRNHGPW